MDQRRVAAFVAAPLVLLLLLTALVLPLPYATYRPGDTVDVLAQRNGRAIIEVEGKKTYRDDGELRMTTVLVSGVGNHLSALELLQAWSDGDAAVYPYEAVHPADQTAEQDQVEGEVDMVTSQDAATAAALRELGYQVRPVPEIFHVEDGAPAEGRLRVRDIVLAVNGTPTATTEDVGDQVRTTEPGEPARFRIRRRGVELTVKVAPREVDGQPRVGIQLGTGFEFPFDVRVNVDPAIGGPSAGLMFALGIYDTLTPGPLTGGHDVAGTGTVTPEGSVGPIGGIQQKVAAARDDGAELFLVPPDNCAEAIGADAGDMRLVRADTVHAAVASLKRWVDDRDAELPSCETSEGAR